MALITNREGKIVATATGAAGAAGGDSSLPDPTRYARLYLLFFATLAVILAIALNALGWTSTAFKASQMATANFGLFASFYAAAQAIERALELISPLLPWWAPPATITNPAAKAAQIKADRGTVILGIAVLLGVGISCGLGLYLLTAIGMHVSHTVDSFFTGLIIAAGTKPLHDFISLIQNQSTPKTGTGTQQ